MICRKCGAEIKEGYTFCRKCATSIEDIGEITVTNINNNVSNTNKASNVNLDKLKKINHNLFKKNEENNASEQFIENKDRITKDMNNKSKAIVDTKITVIGIIIGIIIFFVIVIKVASNL